jgi:hypothetical protein
MLAISGQSTLQYLRISFVDAPLWVFYKSQHWSTFDLWFLCIWLNVFGFNFILGRLLDNILLRLLLLLHLMEVHLHLLCVFWVQHHLLHDLMLDHQLLLHLLHWVRHAEFELLHFKMSLQSWVTAPWTFILVIFKQLNFNACLPSTPTRVWLETIRRTYLAYQCYSLQSWLVYVERVTLQEHSPSCPIDLANLA